MSFVDITVNHFFNSGWRSLKKARIFSKIFKALRQRINYDTEIKMIKKHNKISNNVTLYVVSPIHFLWI